MQIRRFLGTLLNAVAANGAAATRTATISFKDDNSTDAAPTFNRSPQLLRMTAVLTRVAATALTVDLYTSVDGGTTYGRVQSIAVSAGVGVLSDYTPTRTESANMSLDLQIDTRGATHAKVVLSATAGGATDLLTLIGASVEER